ncbi:alginate lyase family protein [Mucilaginibacter sp.]|uniref:alginate lyase family protein n=1 Tax=Mucilaginibacter sp. TaxID=1882438 RepID=UPI0031B616C1
MMKKWHILYCLPLLMLSWQTDTTTVKQQVKATLKADILKEAAWALTQSPVTVTTETCSRSVGGKHDFYSEGDYWWPDPQNPNGPYIQKDGLTNPQNFVAHRLAMIRFSRIIGALASAYKITGDKKYVKQALWHLKAWFVNPETLMNPDLQYAQAIKGVATGRGIGIIDTIQLMEVVQGLEVMQDSPLVDKPTLDATKNWFAQYLTWLTTHQYGKDEMNAKNNHGTCWAMQTACFAKFTGNKEIMDFCRNRFKEVLLPGQIAADGSFPLELKRTKPYGYSIFNLDAMTTLCQILSDKTDNLWTYQTPDGRSIKKGIEFLYPYLKDKNAWPYPHDVMHWESWPVAQPSLVFGAAAYNNADWLNTWKLLEHSPTDEEIIRNLPVRHPLIWLN